MFQEVEAIGRRHYSRRLRLPHGHDGSFLRAPILTLFLLLFERAGNFPVSLSRMIRLIAFYPVTRDKFGEVDLIKYDDIR